MTVQEPRTSYVGRVSMVGASQLAAALVGAVVWPLLARRLGPESFGTFQSAQVLGGFLGYAVFFGLAQHSLWRFSASGRSWKVARGLLRVRLLNGAAVAVLGLLVMLAGAPLGVVVPAWVLMVVVANLVRQSWPDWIFIGGGRTWLLTVVALLSGLVNVGGVVSFVHSPADLDMAAVAYLAAALVGLLALVEAGRRTADAKVSAPDVRWAGELRAAAPLGLAVLAAQVIAYADIGLLNLFGRGAEVGTYAAAYRVVLVVQGLGVAVQGVALAAFSTPGDEGGASGDFARVARLVGGAFLVGAVVLMATSELVTAVLYGDEYGAAGPYLRALAVTLPAEVCAALGMAWLISQGRAAVAARCLGAGAAGTVVVSMLLIPWMGPWGGLIGKSVGVAVVLVGVARSLDAGRGRALLTAGLLVPIPVAAVTAAIIAVGG